MANVLKFNLRCIDCGKDSNDIFFTNALGEEHGPLCSACADRYPVGEEEDN